MALLDFPTAAYGPEQEAAYAHARAHGLPTPANPYHVALLLALIEWYIRAHPHRLNTKNGKTGGRAQMVTTYTSDVELLKVQTALRGDADSRRRVFAQHKGSYAELCEALASTPQVGSENPELEELVATFCDAGSGAGATALRIQRLAGA